MKANILPKVQGIPSEFNMPVQRASGHYRIQVVKKDKGVVLDTEFDNDLTRFFKEAGIGIGSTVSSVRPSLALSESASIDLDNPTENKSNVVGLGTAKLLSKNELGPATSEADALAFYTQHASDPSLDYTETTYTDTLEFTASSEDGKTFRGVGIMAYGVYSSSYWNNSGTFKPWISFARIVDDVGNPLDILKDEDTQIIVTYTLRVYRGSDVVQPFTFDGNDYNLLFTTLRRTDHTKNWLTDPTSIVSRGVVGGDDSGAAIGREQDLLVTYKDSRNQRNQQYYWSIPFKYSTTNYATGVPISDDALTFKLAADPLTSRTIYGLSPLILTASPFVRNAIDDEFTGWARTTSQYVWEIDITPGSNDHTECLIYILDNVGFPTGLVIPKDFGFNITFKFQKVQGEPVVGWPNPLPIAAGNVQGLVLSPNGEPNGLLVEYQFRDNGHFYTRQRRNVGGTITYDQTTDHGFMLPQDATPSDYEVQVTQTAGTTVTENNVSTWTALGAGTKLVTHEEVQSTIGRTFEELDFTIEVREIANTNNAVSVDVTMLLNLDNR